MWQAKRSISQIIGGLVHRIVSMSPFNNISLQFSVKVIISFTINYIVVNVLLLFKFTRV